MQAGSNGITPKFNRTNLTIRRNGSATTTQADSSGIASKNLY